MRTFFLFCLSLPVYFLSGLLIHSCFVLDYSTPSPVLGPLIIGFAAGLLIFIFVNKFIPLYVFGHELAHWIFAKLFLRETGKFKVGRDGGAVEIKNPNLWISLAPYFYPTFTVFWVPFWFLFKYLDDRYPYSLSIYFVILAITWAYHVAMTAYALKFEQSDIEKYGRPISFTLILFINLFVIFIFLSMFTDNAIVACTIFWDTIYEDSLQIYRFISEKISRF